MVGAVGQDAAGDTLLESLQAAGVDCSCVARREVPTGQAFITVDSAGENAIIILAGANSTVSPADVEKLRPQLEQADCLVLQLEIPLETVASAAKLDAAQWQAVQSRASSLGVHPTTLAMAAFADTMRQAAETDFVLNLPIFHTTGHTVEYPDRITDRTRLLTLAVRKADQMSDILARYQAGMTHIRLDGLDVQAMLRERHPEEPLLAPTVFSSTPGIQLVTEPFQTSFGALTYLVSQTPQVCLDAQIYELWDGAYLVWMTPEGLYEHAYLTELFRNWLERLLEEPKGE